MLPVAKYKSGMRVLVLGHIPGLGIIDWGDEWATFIRLYSTEHALVCYEKRCIDSFDPNSVSNSLSAVHRSRLVLSLSQEIIHAAG